MGKEVKNSQCEAGKKVVVVNNGESGGCARFNAGRCGLDRNDCPMVGKLNMMSLDAWHGWWRKELAKGNEQG